MTSVIVPAHNEMSVIGEALETIVGQVNDEGEIIVVCNGCSDDTAGVARRFVPYVKVIETTIASKTAALNVGDAVATTFPRVYMDADIRLGADAIRMIEEALSIGRLLAVSPKPVMDFSWAPWSVRAYYDIWLSLPYCRRGMIGAGVYALSELGRSRFTEFPSIIADDGYVRALFVESERGMVDTAFATVRAPRNLQSLLRIKTRSRLGGLELRARYPHLVKNEEKEYVSAFMDQLRSPARWPKLTVYALVHVVSRYRARGHLANLREYSWERDVSSRQ